MPLPRLNKLKVWLRSKHTYDGHTVQVKKAYVMVTERDINNRAILGNNMDIGIIITKKIGRTLRAFWGLKSLKLPDVYVIVCHE